MIWTLLGLAIALLALVLLLVLLLRLWRRVKALGSAVAQAGEVVDRASRELSAAQDDGPLSATPRPTGVHTRTGQGSGPAA